MQENNYCVYKHTSPSNKVYIGITSQKPERRWENGFGYKDQKYFYRAIQKYGWENIEHEILFENLTKEEACEKEIELIAFYKSNDRKFGYNRTLGGDGIQGHHHSDETRKKLSDSHIGQTPWNKGKTGVQKSHRKGKNISDEQKQKISNTLKGNIPWNKGKKGVQHHSEETKNKLSESVKQTKIKISAAYKDYKSNGGTLTWNEFQREYTNLNN